ncbi:MAG TPA: cytochrome c [Phycisphaerae bacterium]|nr:cytochrome c [Phycisphaerae bacterium]HOJ72574.1 cytochrome c [Phycisphaerae bacterium]HOM49765.1 cytochrome c [Phycisphaerae bacterium]HPP25134.1 cytochrome c [Phycisphaerae bacterium]HPU24895.1 cytochrome c [Phycisphaerae bacterium]
MHAYQHLRRWAAASTGALLMAAGLSVGLSSCADSTDGPTRASTDASARHAVHSAELQAAMRGLGQRSKEEIAAELYTGSPTSTRMQRVAEAAGDIAATADRIPEFLSQVQLDATDRQQFIALARQLGNDAREVQIRARTGDAPAVQQAVNRMDATCNACHSLFRPGGV